jgi:hypothetical protein
MTAGSHSQGVFTKVIISAAGDTDTHDYSTGNGTIIEYASVTMKETGRVIGADNGITGSRSHRSERARYGPSYFTGHIDMMVSSQQFADFLPHMIGDSVSGDVHSLTELQPYFGILIDMDYDTFEFKNCCVDRWVLRSRAPELLERGEPDMLMLRLYIIGSDSAKGTSWPGSAPSLDTGTYYQFADCDAAVTLQGGARIIENFMIYGDNHIYARYVNSLVPHSLIPRDRDIGFRAQVPWNSGNVALYNITLAGATATVKFTTSTKSTLFTFGVLQWPIETPIINGKQEVPLIVNAQARKVGSTNELVVTNDNTA